MDMPAPPPSPQAMLDEIKHSASPAEYKARVMLARDEGWITDDEAEEWIAMAGVGEA